MPHLEKTGEAAARDKDGHVHLRIAQPAEPDASSVKAHRSSWDRARWVVATCGVSSVVAFAASFFQPWWSFKLYAPQYPKGLSLVIYLTGMGGDVHEIDLLNHYIGMKHLATAAETERHLAGYGVAAIGIMTLALLMVAGKKLNRLVFIPALAFPVVFLADSFYWLYSYGHGLDPKAPLRIAAFTPEMFGNGKIGQFETFASPAMGFWLAIAGFVLAAVGTFVRSRVCGECSHAAACGVVCPRLMVLPDAPKANA
jgi:hypothetical protein